MKIAFFEIKNWEKKYLNKALKGHKILYFSEKINEIDLKQLKDVEAISIFIYSKISKEVLAKLPKLKIICTRSTGFDHINLKDCAAKHISVSNVPNYGENTVAEHTFALILSLSRNIHKSYLRTKRDDFSIEGLQGFDLKGKTIGIIGAGSIGLHVIRIAKSFSMKVLAYDPKPNNFLAEVLDFEYRSFREILSNSDIISLHAPDNKETHHLINKNNISLIKKGAILINTSRGGLVDIDALSLALEKNIIAGAGLDVIEGEEYIKEEKQLLYDNDKASKAALVMKDQKIFDRDDVIFTPHIAFYSQEALQRILELTADNIISFSKKERKNIVI